MTEAMTTKEKFEQFHKTGDIALRNELVEEHLYLVDILIRKYLNKGVDYDDLYQVAALALVSAVNRFDPTKGFEFSTFVTPTILGEIKKYFRDKEWMVKVPRRLKEIGAKIPHAKDELQLKLQRAPLVSEIAEYMGHSEEEIIEAMEGARAYSTYSLDRTYEDSGEEGESAVLEKYTAVEDKGYTMIEYDEIIKNVLGKLSEEDQLIFKMRFLENKTQAEIADMLNVSQMTISRAEKAIKEKFKKHFNK